MPRYMIITFLKTTEGNNNESSKGGRILLIGDTNSNYCEFHGEQK